MATKQELINSIKAKVNILKEELVEIKPDGAKRYLIHVFRDIGTDAGIYEHKSLYVWNEGTANEIAKWQGGEPYPEASPSFSNQRRNKIAELISKGTIQAGFV